MIKPSLCCISLTGQDGGRKFQTMTYKRFASMPRQDALQILGDRILNNIDVATYCVRFCDAQGWDYRFSSALFPLITYDKAQVVINDLPNIEKINEAFSRLSWVIQVRPEIIVSPDGDFTELSFATECIVTHFFGRGCAAFELNRSSLADKSCVIDAQAIGECGQMLLSKVANLGRAVRDGHYPAKLNADFRDTSQKVGQNRLTKYFAAEQGQPFIESVVCSSGFDERLPLSVISYGLSDLFTGLWARGVHYLKWQGSLAEAQLYVQHTFSEEQLHEYLLDKSDYEIRAKVSTIGE